MQDALRADAWALSALNSFEQLGDEAAGVVFEVDAATFYCRGYVCISEPYVCAQLKLRMPHFPKVLNNVSCSKFNLRNGRLVWGAWIRRGYVTKENIANWRFGGGHKLELNHGNMECPYLSFSHSLFTIPETVTQNMHIHFFQKSSYIYIYTFQAFQFSFPSCCFAIICPFPLRRHGTGQP